jgi:hypothetical protein
MSEARLHKKSALFQGAIGPRHNVNLSRGRVITVVKYSAIRRAIQAKETLAAKKQLSEMHLIEMK